MSEHQKFPWRVGRKVGRTVYAVVSRSASDADILIGVMDTPAIAAEAVDAHNARIKWVASDELQGNGGSVDG